MGVPSYDRCCANKANRTFGDVINIEARLLIWDNGNYKNNYDTETTTANKSMGFDPSAIQSCKFLVLILTSSIRHS